MIIREKKFIQIIDFPPHFSSFHHYQGPVRLKMSFRGQKREH